MLCAIALRYISILVPNIKMLYLTKYNNTFVVSLVAGFMI